MRPHFARSIDLLLLAFYFLSLTVIRGAVTADRETWSVYDTPQPGAADLLSQTHTGSAAVAAALSDSKVRSSIEMEAAEADPAGSAYALGFKFADLVKVIPGSLLAHQSHFACTAIHRLSLGFCLGQMLG
jgi:hypothetical protein